MINYIIYLIIYYPFIPCKSARILTPYNNKSQILHLLPTHIAFSVLIPADSNQYLPSQLINSTLFQQVFSVFNLLCRFVVTPFCNDFITQLYAKSVKPNHIIIINIIIIISIIQIYIIKYIIFTRRKGNYFHICKKSIRK